MGGSRQFPLLVQYHIFGVLAPIQFAALNVGVSDEWPFFLSDNEDKVPSWRSLILFFGWWPRL
jgi:hypothetical protein